MKSIMNNGDTTFKYFQYGDDYMITQYMGKGVDDIILGNGRDLNFDNDNNSAPVPQAMELETSSEDDLPF